MAEARPTAEEKPDDSGLRCPECGCKRLAVYYTRNRSGGRRLRVRECEHCGRRFSTIERLA